MAFLSLCDSFYLLLLFVFQRYDPTISKSSSLFFDKTHKNVQNHRNLEHLIDIEKKLIKVLEMDLLVRRLAASFYLLCNVESEERDCQTRKNRGQTLTARYREIKSFLFSPFFSVFLFIFFTFPPDPFVPQLFPKTVLFRAKLLD